MDSEQSACKAFIGTRSDMATSAYSNSSLQQDVSWRKRIETSPRRSTLDMLLYTEIRMLNTAILIPSVVMLRTTGITDYFFIHPYDQQQLSRPFP